MDNVHVSYLTRRIEALEEKIQKGDAEREKLSKKVFELEAKSARLTEVPSDESFMPSKSYDEFMSELDRMATDLPSLIDCVKDWYILKNFR
jgi:hypothetical protein